MSLRESRKTDRRKSSSSPIMSPRGSEGSSSGGAQPNLSNEAAQQDDRERPIVEVSPHREIIERIRADQASESDHIKLQKLMLDEKVYDEVASDPGLFPKMYERAKDPKIDPGYQFSPDTDVDAAKRRQDIHSTYDQLHYILWRTGAGGQRSGSGPRNATSSTAVSQRTVPSEVPGGSGLANRRFSAQGGTEEPIGMSAETARAVQYDAIARLIALHLHETSGGSPNQPVRMPVYSHRAGPMKQPEDSEHYFETAANNFNSILTTPDQGGANIRVTAADRGPGAYTSTDSDNYYGPHGFAFDPRDLHQLPLSKSDDNKHQHSSERKANEGHQFRAMGTPIYMTEDGRAKYADIFAKAGEKSAKALHQRLIPKDMTAGILGDTVGEMLRRRLRQTAMNTKAESMRRTNRSAESGSSSSTLADFDPLPVTGSEPATLHDSPDHEQPKDAAHVYMMRSLVQEMNGLYEPHHWAKSWKNTSQERLMKGMLATMAALPKQATEDDDGDVSKSEWDD